jgi:hypothetical protein
MYHINPASGKVGTCRAVKGNCPFGRGHHFLTQQEALEQVNTMGEAYFEFYQRKQSFRDLTFNEFTQELQHQYPQKWKELLGLTSFTVLTQHSFYINEGTLYVTGLDGVAKHLMILTPKGKEWHIVADYIPHEQELEVYLQNWPDKIDLLSLQLMQMDSEINEGIDWNELSPIHQVDLAPLLSFPLDYSSINKIVVIEEPDISAIPEEWNPRQFILRDLPFRS